MYVNGLKNVFNLSLISCDNLEDISGLGNHHEITIDNFPSFVKGLECLYNVPIVTFGRVDISDFIAGPKLRKLSLTFCRCSKRIDFDSWSHLKELKFSLFSYPFPIDYYSLRNIPRLSLLDISQFDNLPQMTGNHDFVALGPVSTMIQDFTFLRYARSIELEYHPQPFSCDKFQYVVSLKISNFGQILNLGFCRSLQYCTFIYQIVILIISMDYSRFTR